MTKDVPRTHASFDPLRWVLLFLVALLVVGSTVVWVLEALRVQRNKVAILSAARTPTTLLRDFISELDEVAIEPKFVGELTQKIIAVDLAEDLSSRSGGGGWVELMDALRARELVAPDRWTAYVDKLFSEAEDAKDPEAVLVHLLRYERKGWLQPEMSVRLLGLAVALPGKRRPHRGIQKLVLDARKAGKVSDQDWAALVRRSFDLRLVARQKVRHGSPLPVRFDRDGRRSGVWKVYQASSNLEALVVDGENFASDTTFSDGLWAGRKYLVPLVHRSGQDFLPGEHKVVVRMRFQVTARDGQSFEPLEWWVEEEKAFTVVPATQELVELISGPPEDLEPLDFIHDPVVEVGVEEGRPQTRLAFDVRYPPVAFSYDVFWKTGEGEVPLGSFFWRAVSRERHIRSSGGWRFPSNPEGPTVDLVFRPNRRLAEREADCYRIWGDEFVLEALPVTVLDGPFSRRRMSKRGVSRVLTPQRE